jgi:hypothetical protein
MCSKHGNFTLVRNGICMKCDTLREHNRGILRKDTIVVIVAVVPGIMCPRSPLIRPRYRAK